MRLVDQPDVSPSAWYSKYQVQRWFDDALQETIANAKRRFAETMTTTLPCFGGPLHGKTIKVVKGTPRFEIPTHEIPRPDLDFFWDAPIDFEPSRLKAVSYAVDAVHERYRSFHHKFEFCLVEGMNLLPHEEKDLRAALQEVPWTITYPASILHNFQEWWRQAVYKHMGQLIRD